MLKNDAWGAPSASTEVGNTDLSIDPFSPVAQKELTEFDMLRNEIEAGKSTNNGGTEIIRIFKLLILTIYSNDFRIQQKSWQFDEFSDLFTTNVDYQNWRKNLTLSFSIKNKLFTLQVQLHPTLLI